MAWIESHTLLLRHRKLIALAKALRLKPVYCLGHLHALWHVAMEQAEDGDLSSWSDEFIAESAGFQGDAPQFVSLLQMHGWLDGKILHDWLDYAGRFLRGKYSTREKTKLVEIWAKYGKVYGNADHQPTSCRPPADKLPTPTLPNHTIPNQTKRKEKDKETSPPDKPPAVSPQVIAASNSNGIGPPKNTHYSAPKTDIQRVVAGFKAVLSVSDDDREWDRVYFRRYSRPASELLTLFGGDIERVADCIDQVSSALDKRRLSWTPETIVKHAGDWKNGRLFQ